MKLDLRKAYDSVSWKSLLQIMDALKFPNKFIDWIRFCVTSAAYSVLLDDDLIVACRGDLPSIDCVLAGLNHFKQTTSLQLNYDKSQVYVGGVSDTILESILHKTNMSLGSFPFRYLGAPISDSRISEKECDKLVEKMSLKITSWATKHLSYAGRTKLINSVLYGIANFWSRIFVLPNSVMRKVMALCRNFLWSSGPVHRRCPLIKWEEVCLPKQEGGLGLKNLLFWNQACSMKLLWDIANKKDSLWVRWVHSKYLKQGTIWECNVKNDDCYYWKKLIQNRRLFVGMNTANGYTVKEGYNWLKGIRMKVDWAEVVWSRWLIPLRNWRRRWSWEEAGNRNGAWLHTLQHVAILSGRLETRRFIRAKESRRNLHFGVLVKLLVYHLRVKG
ncbi:unnamed protein product [Cuscuta campestris]|uniref:Uncharacterized protein n=1 Tax=Cuscuta campestris TaxID=132261 RepID=A0A484KIZ6_9ASTE|nr:unnamed protein product [Cuscuta campestris]